MRSRLLGGSLLVGMLALLASPPALAQASSELGTVVLIPAPLVGPGSMGPRGERRFCNARAAGLAEWRVSFITRLVRPSEAQKPALAELVAASAKARQLIANACKTPSSESHLAIMETRLDALLQAVKTVRPAYETFYTKLDDKQKARLDVIGPRRHGWQW